MDRGHGRESGDGQRNKAQRDKEQIRDKQQERRHAAPSDQTEESADF